MTRRVPPTRHRFSRLDTSFADDGLQARHSRDGCATFLLEKADCPAFHYALSNRPFMYTFTPVVTAFVGFHAAAAVHVEFGMFPSHEHVGAFFREQALSDQKGKHARTEKLFERLERRIGHNINKTGDRRLEAGGRRPETGGWRLEENWIKPIVFIFL